MNDYGGGSDGAGGDHAPADEVVSEIERAGGQAAANHDSVATMAGGQASSRPRSTTSGASTSWSTTRGSCATA